MLAYGRRLLELNDQAARAVQGGELSGRVRLGMQEDFGEMVLPQVLGQFARAHSKVRIEARVARNAELLERLAVGQLDLVLAWDHDARLPHAQRLLDLPMRWIGPAQEAMADRLAKAVGEKELGETLAAMRRLSEALDALAEES